MTQNQYVALECAGPICNVLLVFVLFMRRRAASFPIFTTCTAIGALISIAIPYAYFHYSAQTSTNIFWTLCILDLTLELPMIYELATHVFRPAGVWAPDIRKALLIIAGVSIVLAASLASMIHPLSTVPFYAFMHRIERFYSILISGLLVGMLILSSNAGLPWKTHAGRIAQIYCAGAIYGLLFEIAYDRMSIAQLTRFYRPMLYTQKILSPVWIVCLIVLLWRDEPAPQQLPEPLRNQLHTLQQQAENDLTKIRSWKNS